MGVTANGKGPMMLSGEGRESGEVWWAQHDGIEGMRDDGVADEAVVLRATRVAADR